jgi:beta-carotene hydroxylase
MTNQSEGRFPMTQTLLSMPQDAFRLPSLTELGRDLVLLTRRQRWFALALPLGCVVGFAFFASMGYLTGAVLATVAYTFYSYGSTSHDLVHRSLGLPTWLNDILLSLIELAGLRSGHAYQAAHLHHHAQFPDLDDVEGAAAHGSFVGSLLAGPVQQPRIWWWALRHSRRNRVWIALEGLACIGLIVGSILAWPITPMPLVYAVLVVVGSWSFPLMTGYLPHTPGGATTLTQTRRFRGTVAALLFRQHLYHLEHHLYPAVPHQRWPQLAERLDPYLDRAGVKPIYLGF